MHTPPFPTRFNPFSTSFRSTLNEIGTDALDWGANSTDIEERIAALEARVNRIQPTFPAVLNTAKLMTNAGATQKRWKYAFEEFIPGVALSPRGFPGQGSSATSDPSSWVRTPGQRSSWGNNGTDSYSETADPYGFYAINLAEITNDEVAIGADGYASWGQTVGTGPAGTGTLGLLSVGNVADATADQARRPGVIMFQLTGPQVSAIDPDNTTGTIFAFAAGNEVEVSCT